MKKLTLLLLALLYVTLTYAYTERDLLQKQADINRLKEILVLDRQWVTYPDYNDRAGWDRFLGTFKDEYIRRGEKRLNYRKTFWCQQRCHCRPSNGRVGRRERTICRPTYQRSVQCLRNDIMGTGRTYHRATFPQSITRIRLSCHRPYFR